MLIWFKWGNPFMGGDLQIADIWTLTDGDQVLLTNRVPDLPTWFSLHFGEVQSPSVAVLERFMATNKAPNGPMDGPNIWRVSCGDLLAWTGVPRPGLGSDEGVLRIFRFTAECLALGDVKEGALFEMMFDEAESRKPEQMKRAQHAASLVRQMGIPREFSAEGEWKMSLLS
jgi:hypothetical protein